MALWIAGKVTGKIGLNFLLPGSGSVVDFGEAVTYYSLGDPISGTISLGFGLIGLIPVFGGTATSLKDVSTAVAEASISSAKEISKEIGSQAAQQIAKEGLEGAAKEAVVEGAKIATETFVKDAGKEIIVNAVKETSKDLALEAMKETGKELINDASKEVLKEGLKNAGESASKAVILDVIDIVRSFF